MEYDSKKGVIYMGKVLNGLDKFTIDFIKVLEKFTDYVIVSGYVSILLGRTRASEDVDMLVPEMGFEDFNKMFVELDSNGFECLNTSVSREAFGMLDHHAIAFSKIGMPVPHMEFKKITNGIQKEALNGRLKVVLGREKTFIYISPLELQIAYKLSLISQGNFEEISSDKDFEDAKHIYEVFKDVIDIQKVIYYVNMFNVGDMWKWLQK